MVFPPTKSTLAQEYFQAYFHALSTTPINSPFEEYLTQKASDLLTLLSITGWTLFFGICVGVCGISSVFANSRPLSPNPLSLDSLLWCGLGAGSESRRLVFFPICENVGWLFCSLLIEGKERVNILRYKCLLLSSGSQELSSTFRRDFMLSSRSCITVEIGKGILVSNPIGISSLFTNLFVSLLKLLVCPFYYSHFI